MYDFVEERKGNNQSLQENPLDNKIKQNTYNPLDDKIKIEYYSIIQSRY